jgi:molybdopterin converting factor subunit 1
MKSVRVRLFAAYRDAAGQSEVPIETGADSLDGLFHELAERFPELGEVPRAMVALNDELVAWDTSFADGDEVLFFPPVSGG